MLLLVCVIVKGPSGGRKHAVIWTEKFNKQKKKIDLTEYWSNDGLTNDNWKGLYRNSRYKEQPLLLELKCCTSGRTPPPLPPRLTSRLCLGWYSLGSLSGRQVTEVWHQQNLLKMLFLGYWRSHHMEDATSTTPLQNHPSRCHHSATLSFEGETEKVITKCCTLVVMAKGPKGMLESAVHRKIAHWQQ